MAETPLNPDIDFTIKIRRIKTPLPSRMWQGTITMRWPQTGERHKEVLTGSIYHLLRRACLHKIIHYIEKSPQDRKAPSIRLMPEHQ